MDPPLIRREIANRARMRGAAYWEAAFPGLPPEGRAGRAIRGMLTHATVSGALAASGAPAAEVMSLEGTGRGSFVAVFLGLLSVAADMAYTTALRIDLAFDLASSYDEPFLGPGSGRDLDDPRDGDRRRTRPKAASPRSAVAAGRDQAVAGRAADGARRLRTQCGRRLLQQSILGAVAVDVEEAERVAQRFRMGDPELALAAAPGRALAVALKGST